jgi:uncharacterized membrane protein YhaH (DUF805 family)
MNFLESLQTCYKKIFNYRERASKSEFWWFQLYFTLFAILTFHYVDHSYYGNHSFVKVLIFLWFFNNLPLLSAAVRRFHDMNKSGWNVLWGSIPFIGVFILLIMLIGDGTKGKNTFGPKPKK